MDNALIRSKIPLLLCLLSRPRIVAATIMMTATPMDIAMETRMAMRTGEVMATLTDMATRTDTTITTTHTTKQTSPLNCKQQQFFMYLCSTATM